MMCSYSELAGPISLAVAVGVAVGLAAARSWRKIPELRIGSGTPTVAPPPLAGRGAELVELGRRNQGIRPEDDR